MEYLLHWRMELARRRLVGGASVAETAFAAGYASEPAFSRAFKRVFGVSPQSLRPHHPA
jgi:AraC-like DNA-binding protein